MKFVKSEKLTKNGKIEYYVYLLDVLIIKFYIIHMDSTKKNYKTEYEIDFRDYENRQITIEYGSNTVEKTVKIAKKICKRIIITEVI